ncbi:hypothetical protein KGD82_27740 (plasmid) [Nocardiopsis eucommiae]|uniref:Uncharacterized protein n=1 Tax=Nocardiopsis eucommiae TaxID=2831970 RepID=A0A975LD70_9ACTN|nr:hypothetical protein KGD82_27740 [Nocardiopsis eucommiae]
MDMDMQAFLEEVATQATAAPRRDAPADYLHQRALVLAAVLRAVAEGEHPADALEVMEEQLTKADQPEGAVIVSTPEWGGQLATAAA